MFICLLFLPLYMPSKHPQNRFRPANPMLARIAIIRPMTTLVVHDKLFKYPKMTISQTKQFIKNFDIQKALGLVIFSPLPTILVKDLGVYEITEILSPEKGEKRFEIWLEEIETGKINMFKSSKFTIIKYCKKFYNGK